MDKYTFVFRNNGSYADDQCLNFLYAKGIKFSLSDDAIIFDNIKAPTGSRVYYDKGDIFVNEPSLTDADLNFLTVKFFRKLAHKRTFAEPSQSIEDNILYYLPHLLYKLDKTMDLTYEDYFVLEKKFRSLCDYVAPSTAEKWERIYVSFLEKRDLSKSYF